MDGSLPRRGTSLDGRLREIRLPGGLAARLQSWARVSAPREGCGLLIGRSAGWRTEVVRVTWARNVDPREDRYEVDPEGLLTAERAARASGLGVVGVWHSHPRGAAAPSTTDRRGAYGGWSYVIVRAAETRSFRLVKGVFEEEVVRTGGARPAADAG